MEIPEIEFNDQRNQSLLSDLSQKIQEINREKAYGGLIREVERPNGRESNERFELRDGMTRIISAENLEHLRELGNVYRRVGWVPTGLVLQRLDRFEIELTFDESQSPFNQ